MRKSGMCLISMLVFIIGLAACDNDNNTNAQEPISMDCPCFTKDSLISAIKDTGEEATCTIDAVGFVFDAGGPLGGLAEVGCLVNTNQCSCRLNVDVHDNLNFIQVTTCLNHMIDALLDFEKEGISFGGCSLDAIE